MATDRLKIGGYRDLVGAGGLRGVEATEPNAKRRPLSAVPDAQREGEYQKASAGPFFARARMDDENEIHPHVTHATASGPLDFAKYTRPQFNGEMPAENLSDLLDRVSKNSTGEIDSLIGEFERLRGKLQTGGERIKREIEEYRALSQQVMQLAKTISESVEKVRASADRPTTERD